MIPYPHQESMSDEALDILREHAIVYLASEERTGKTLTAILVAEKSKAKNILVITKKKALDGWNETLTAYPHKKVYKVTNYHQAHKVDPSNYDLIVLDESHNYISAFPKPGGMWKKLLDVCRNKPIMYMSATPYAQGPQMLYHQLALSSWSPWKNHKNFYQWFRLYGKPYELKINGVPIRQYDKCDKDLILGTCEHLFITKTRTELGFEHEPEDVLHYVELSEDTKALYNQLMEHNIAFLDQGKELVCDTSPKLRVTLHMLEGGVAKIEKEYLVLENEEKINFIRDTFGDTEQLVIMYNYKAEHTKLSQRFRRATLLQATSFAEGVDLSGFEHLVIYSQDFSTARHTQRRARQANKKRATAIRVHYLLVKGGLSENVYKTVSINKQNFVDSVFERNLL
tara:strand:+ start:16997 stop:18190 length:1194 start_codon:yes stop_codon:yes gene_type:complete